MWEKEFNLTDRNSFGFNVKAENYTAITQIDTLESALADIAENNWPLLILGGGSNLILRQYIPGAVISIANMGIKVLADDEDLAIVEVGAGENWHNFIGHLLEMGLHGLENLALIPGNVGAAPVQNIGAYGVELADCFHSLTAYDRQTRSLVQLSRDECDFGYRDSIFKSAEQGRYIIWNVRFKLSSVFVPRLDYKALADYVLGEVLGDASGDALGQDSKTPTAHDVYKAVCDIRSSKLPVPTEIGNAGSFFENPVVAEKQYFELKDQYPNLVGHKDSAGLYKLAAGWLIDQAGWKGYVHAGVGVYDKQALVLVNRGKGTVDELTELSEMIFDSVKSKFGISLCVEPRFYPA